VLGGRGQAIGACPLILFTVSGRRVEIQYTANRCGVLIMRAQLSVVAVCDSLYGPVIVVKINSILFHFSAANSDVLQNTYVY
jgi:hypothetical protein